VSIHLHLLDDDTDSPKTFAPAGESERIALIVCSLCLRVLRGSSWIEAEEVIRKLRSYELPALPTLLPGQCDDCYDAIRSRRGLALDSDAA
jgi:hypothetical protein